MTGKRAVWHQEIEPWGFSTGFLLLKMPEEDKKESPSLLGILPIAKLVKETVPQNLGHLRQFLGVLT